MPGDKNPLLQVESAKYWLIWKHVQRPQSVARDWYVGVFESVFKNVRKFGRQFSNLMILKA